MTRALLLLVLLAPLAPLAPAATPTADWWGPTQSMLDGWHIRVPVVVRNPGTRDLQDAVVAYDLDLGKALLDAGWTSGRQGSARRIQAFELDERSVRVLEYETLDPASPARGLLASQSAAASEVRLGFPDRTTGYNNRTQPDVHVEWVAHGKLAAGGARWFMIYADIRAYGDKPPIEYDTAAWAPLESYRWISRGTTLVGRAQSIQVVALEDDTTALVEAYVGGRPVPITSPGGSTTTNPLQLRRGQLAVMEISTQPVLVRIQSDKPVVAAAGSNPSGFFPSEEGSLLGRSFTFASGTGFAILTPRTGATVRIEAPGNEPVERLLSPQSVLAVDGVRGTEVPFRIVADAPILVQGWPGSRARVQLPTLAGAPLGVRMDGIALGGSYFTGDLNAPPGPGEPRPPDFRPPCNNARQGLDPGEVVVTTFEPEVWVRARDMTTGRLLYPTGDAGGESPTSARATLAKPWRQPVASGNLCPLIIHGAPPEGTTFASSGRFITYAGAPSSIAHIVSPLGGRNSTSFIAYENVSVVALHNGTSVTVTKAEGTKAPVGLGAGDVLEVPGRVDLWSRIDATKPVLAVPEGVGGFFAGVDASVKAETLGPAEYRGYLVSVEPAGDAAEPMVGVAAPGKPAIYKLVVKNLARDARGNGVADTVRLSTSPLPEGWTATLSAPSLALAGGQGREVTLTVTPPREAEEGNSVTLSVSAASDALPAMVDRLQVVTLIRARYGVDLWLDREGGSKSRTLVFEPSHEVRVPVVVKNLASVQDQILLSATPLSADWRARFEESGRDLHEVTLLPGETRTLQVLVRAPAEGGSQSLLQVVATSLSDASAAAQVSAGLRMRSDARIDLEVDRQIVEALPDEEVRFRLAFRNLGTEAVGIEFNTTGSLPANWTRPETLVGEHHVDELEGLLPGSVTHIDLVSRVPHGALRGEVANLHFVLRTIPKFAGDIALKESIDLRVLVGADHRLETTDATHDVVADETGTALARLAVRNHGNLDETLRVRPVDLPDGASFAAATEMSLPRGDEGSLTIALRLPGTTPAGAYPADLELVADDGTALPWRVNVTVLPRARVALDPDSPQESVAGVPTRARVEARNLGNVPLPLPPRLVLPEGWSVSWGEAALGELAPGAAASLEMVLHVPRSENASQHVLRSDPEWADAGELSWDVHTVRLRAELLDSPSPTVRVHNDGTGDARDVVVELLDEGTPRDQVVLRRIPAGGSALAVLVPPPGAAREVAVLVDANATYAEAPASFVVRVEGPRGVPFAPVWALGAVAAVAALCRRRRS